MENTALQAFGIGCLFFLVFILCREIICWYWKINEAVQLLKESAEEAKITNDFLERLLKK